MALITRFRTKSWAELDQLAIMIRMICGIDIHNSARRKAEEVSGNTPDRDYMYYARFVNPASFRPSNPAEFAVFFVEREVKAGVD